MAYGSIGPLVIAGRTTKDFPTDHKAEMAKNQTRKGSLSTPDIREQLTLEACSMLMTCFKKRKVE